MPSHRSQRSHRRRTRATASSSSYEPTSGTVSSSSSTESQESVSPSLGRPSPLLSSPGTPSPSPSRATPGTGTWKKLKLCRPANHGDTTAAWARDAGFRAQWERRGRGRGEQIVCTQRNGPTITMSLPAGYGRAAGAQDEVVTVYLQKKNGNKADNDGVAMDCIVCRHEAGFCTSRAQGSASGGNGSVMEQEESAASEKDQEESGDGGLEESLREGVQLSPGGQERNLSLLDGLDQTFDQQPMLEPRGEKQKPPRELPAPPLRDNNLLLEPRGEEEKTPTEQRTPPEDKELEPCGKKEKTHTEQRTPPGDENPILESHGEKEQTPREHHTPQRDKDPLMEPRGEKEKTPTEQRTPPGDDNLMLEPRGEDKQTPRERPTSPRTEPRSPMEIPPPPSIHRSPSYINEDATAPMASRFSSPMGIQESPIQGLSTILEEEYEGEQTPPTNRTQTAMTSILPMPTTMTPPLSMARRSSQQPEDSLMGNLERTSRETGPESGQESPPRMLDVAQAEQPGFNQTFVVQSPRQTLSSQNTSSGDTTMTPLKEPEEEMQTSVEEITESVVVTPPNLQVRGGQQDYGRNGVQTKRTGISQEIMRDWETPPPPPNNSPNFAPGDPEEEVSTVPPPPLHPNQSRLLRYIRSVEAEIAQLLPPPAEAGLPMTITEMLNSSKATEMRVVQRTFPEQGRWMLQVEATPSQGEENVVTLVTNACGVERKKTIRTPVGVVWDGGLLEGEEEEQQ